MDTQQIVSRYFWRIDGAPGQHRTAEEQPKRVRNFPYDFLLMMTDRLAQHCGKNR
jgi:hypothetical protein